MDSRRMSDHDQTAEIEKMIAEEADPRIRVQLMMMHRLTGSVATIGITVADLDKKFTNHARGEEALLNQVRGGWKVAAWVFGIAQTVFCFAYLDIRSDVKDLTTKAYEDKTSHAAINNRLDVIERQLKITHK